MKKKQISYFFLVLLFFPTILFASNNLEIALRHDISDSQLDDFSHIEAAFVLSGVIDQDSLQFYMDWYENLVATLRNYNFDPFDQEASAAKVFNYLHGTWLKKYKERATTLLNVVKEKRFNCVAGTILFNLICEDLGWSTEAFETPTHTYTIFPTFTRQLMVENTSPMGFDMMKNLHIYNRYLLQFYPEKQALNIGLDQIYAYENSKGRKISNTELLGLLAYNRAYFAKEKQDYKTAYNYVLLAQHFNRDSRSNINFEIDLYFKWGIKLFNEQNYPDAFKIFSDAHRRYPDNENFQKNCKAAFFNSQIQTWQNKNWNTCYQIINDIFTIDILTKDDVNRLEKMLVNWANYFFQTKQKHQANQLIDIWERVDDTDKKLIDFKRAIQSINK